MKHLATLALTLLLGAGAFAQQTKYSKVRIYINETGLAQLAAAGLAVDHGTYRPGAYFESVFSATDVARIEQSGHAYDILVDDMAAQLEKRTSNAAPAKSGGGGSGICGGGIGDYPVPEHFELGSMGGYPTYDELLAELDSMFLLFPNLITQKQAIDTFVTHEGRPIHWVKISDNPGVDETGEPQILFDALHHAREPASLTQLLYFMYYLLENYNTDPQIQYLVDNTEIYFVPCVNPDGYVYNQTTNPDGSGYWRRNKRDNDGDGFFDPDVDGVDLNRNYGHFWGFDNIGSSPGWNSEIYRGPSAFSEPETQAMKHFCESHNFQIALNYHTFSNVLIYPWGYTASSFTPDSATFVAIGDLLSLQNGYAHGTTDQTIGYVANGDSDDWMYGEQSTKNKILAMTPEVGGDDDGFWPPVDRIVPLAQENMWANLSALWLLHPYAALSTNIGTYTMGSETPSADFDLQSIGLPDSSSFTVTLVPQSTNIANIETPVSFNNMAHLQTASGSIGFTLAPGTLPGETLTYNLVVNNGIADIYTVEINQLVGLPNLLYQNGAENLDSWDSGTWQTTTEDFYTPSSSITDSPFSDYPPNTYTFIRLSDTIDLSDDNMVAAQLHFRAKWAIEQGWDYAQLEAVDVNSGASTPLCGMYTRLGNSNQAEGQPIYDGMQNSWVLETVDLADFLGRQIQIQFSLTSDPYVEEDGFYFDDIKVMALHSEGGPPVGVAANQAKGEGLQVWQNTPNPANGATRIAYTLYEKSSQRQGAYTFELSNNVGQLVYSRSLPANERQGSIALNTDKLPKGMYHYRIRAGKICSPARKLVIVR